MIIERKQYAIDCYCDVSFSQQHSPLAWYPVNWHVTGLAPSIIMLVIIMYTNQNTPISNFTYFFK